MTSQTAALVREIQGRAFAAARATIRIEAGQAWTEDPVSRGLRRNRVNAELIKACLQADPSIRSARFPDALVLSMVRWLLSQQEPSGAWHERHALYDEPSALETSFAGDALLLATKGLPVPEKLHQEIDVATGRARDFVLLAEAADGYFLKSRRYVADHLNVDASCAAFLALFGRHRHDASAQAAARRTLGHVALHQRADGMIPYTTAAGGAPYRAPLDVPCLHYQGVTAYYWHKAEAALGDARSPGWRRAIEWLRDRQRPDGRFEWSHSRLGFARYLSAAYAFAAACLTVQENGADVRTRVLPTLRTLDSMVPGLAWRWEPGRGSSALAALRAGRLGLSNRGPPAHRAFQAIYFAHREYARRRTSDRVRDAFTALVRRGFGLHASTVESSANYPDLFMTSEILDCLGFVSKFLSPDKDGHRQGSQP